MRSSPLSPSARDSRGCARGPYGPRPDLDRHVARRALDARVVRPRVRTLGVPVPRGPGGAPSQDRASPPTRGLSRAPGLPSRNLGPRPASPRVGRLPRRRPCLLRLAGRGRQCGRTAARAVPQGGPGGRGNRAHGEDRPPRLGGVGVAHRLFPERRGPLRALSTLYATEGGPVASLVAGGRPAPDLIADRAGGAGRGGTPSGRRGGTATITIPLFSFS